MGKKDARVDEYIHRSAEFARPILTHIRGLVHQGCPDVSETVKWGFPHFEYKGVLCSMAAFREHCAMTFWKGKLIFGKGKTGEAMGQFGRITSVSGLPPKKTLLGYVKEAARLNEAGVKIARSARPKPGERKEVEVPDVLRKALRSNKKALSTFEKFSYSHKKEYIEWITEAKADATREKRLALAVDWMAEGKSRNWKYDRKQGESGKGK